MQNSTRRPRRHLPAAVLAAALAIALGLAGRLAAQGPPGGGGFPGGGPPGGGPAGGPPGGPGGGAGSPSAANSAGSNISFATANGKWVWLRQAENKPAVLFLAPAGQPGKEIGQGEGWNSVVLDGDVIWVSASKGNAGVLLRVAETGVAEEVVRCAGKPSGLRAREGRLFWAERSVAPTQAPIFIPTLSDQVTVRVRENDGTVRDLASWPAGADAKGLDTLPGVTAMSESALYLRVPRLFSTEFVEVPLSGGAPARIAVAAEVQHGALYRGEFYWTARSREATTSMGMRRVCRRGDPEEQTVAEWLPSGGSLTATDQGLLYVAEGVYRIPDKLGMPKRLGSAQAFHGAADPKGLVLIDPAGGAPPKLFREE